MSRQHTDYHFNAVHGVAPGAFHIGNATSAFDFATRVPGPMALGAGKVPPAGVYATHLDIKPKERSEIPAVESILPQVFVAAVLAGVLLLRR